MAGLTHSQAEKTYGQIFHEHKGTNITIHNAPQWRSNQNQTRMTYAGNNGTEVHMRTVGKRSAFSPKRYSQGKYIHAQGMAHVDFNDYMNRDG